MKGVAYQENYQPNGTASQNPTNTSYTDPLADPAKCRRDIPILKQIYTNVIRVYAIDPAQNHDDCMEQLAAADIYVIADLGEPGTSIISDTPEWDVSLYRRYTGVVDTLQKYKNVIGFFAGNCASTVCALLYSNFSSLCSMSRLFPSLGKARTWLLVYTCLDTKSDLSACVATAQWCRPLE